MTEEIKEDDVHLDDEGNIIEPPKEEPKEEVEDERTAKHEDDHEDEQGEEGESEEDAEARRERNRTRRAENKQRRKDYVESLKREIAARDEILQQMAGRLDAVERRANGADMAMVDAELKKSFDAYTYYKQAHADAVTRADGMAAVEAQEKMMQINQRAQQLQAIKNAAENAKKQPPAQPLDPRLRNHAEAWLEKNQWYDVNGKDRDSRIAQTLDRELAEEGWNPTTEQYWEELDSRLKQYLPHRYNSGYNKSTNSGNRRPSPVAGSGRETSNSSKGGYRLSADRVQALKDAGVWDDPKQRAEAIKRYQEYDKQQGA